MINGVYPAAATISYACNTGYYLSTLTVIPLIATCTISGINVGNWTAVPSCLKLAVTNCTGGTCNGRYKTFYFKNLFEFEITAIPIALTITKISMTLSCSFLVIAIGLIIAVTILIRLDYHL